MAVRRRKGSPYWWYDFTVAGRRLRGSTQTDDRATAEIIAAKRRADALLAEVSGRRQRITLDQAFGRYWLEHAQYLASGLTLRYQIGNLRQLLGKDLPLDGLANATIAEAVSRLRGRMSASSVNRHLTLLRAIVNRARDAWDYETPAINWRTHWLKEPPPRDRWASHDEADRLIACAAPHLRPAIVFSLLTGVRLGNCIGLDWRQVDMKARVIRVNLKGGRRHVVPMSEAVLVLLANLGPRDEGPVFAYKGRRLKSWKTAWNAAKRRAGIKDLRWHDLRHTFATWARQAGADLGVIQQLLGHTNIATTMRYAHHGPGETQRAMEAIASHWRHNAPQGPQQVADAKRK